MAWVADERTVRVREASGVFYWRASNPWEETNDAD